MAKKTKKSDQLVSFRTKLQKKDRFYFEVIVFPTKDHMQADFSHFCELVDIEEEKTDFIAMVIPIEERNKNDLLKSRLGFIYFSKEDLNVSTVCHEAIHAALHYVRVVYKNKQAKFGSQNNDKEEGFAYLVDFLVDDLFACLAYLKCI